MFPQEFHIIPVFDDPVGERVLQFIESSFITVEFFSDVGFLLVIGVGDHHFVFGSPYSA